jgi:hypothetical protein
MRTDRSAHRWYEVTVARRLLLIAALLGAGAGAARAGEGNTKLATREEAAASFFKGCIEQVDAAPELSMQKKRVICEETRDCVIDAMFTREGARKRPFSEIGNFIAPCLARGRRKALGKSEGTLWTGEPLRLEIFRPENNGLMNSVPAVVELENAECAREIEGPVNRAPDEDRDTVLFGGDRVMCIVRAAEVRIAVSTPRRKRPPGFMPAARSWDTARLTRRFAAGQVIRMIVLPKSRGSSYVGGWTIQPAPVE